MMRPDMEQMQAKQVRKAQTTTQLLARTHHTIRSLVEQSKEAREEQVKVVRMLTVIRRRTRRWGEKQERERREVVNRNRKCCDIIMRHVARVYPHD